MDNKPDKFTAYQKDPRLEKSIYKTTLNKQTFLKNELRDRVLGLKDEEAFLDELRRYKREKHGEIIQTLEKDPLKNRAQILSRLSDVADKIVMAAQAFLKRRMEAAYGLPAYLTSYKQTATAHLGIVAMGKWGARKLNYHSDLDMIFVYSHRGETAGKKQIDNSEYFVKLVQKMITALSVTTTRGRCYEIDVELRPSGHFGPLVTSYDHFIDHQMNRAEHWERQALLPARPLSEDSGFQKRLEAQIDKLAYERPLPSDFIRTMHGIRERVIRERARQTTPKRFDIKLGSGGLMDIEFILHAIQLKNARIFSDLRQRSLFDLLGALNRHEILKSGELAKLTEAHLYYRTIESLLHLAKHRAETVLDFDSETFEEICGKLGCGKTELWETVQAFRQDVKKTYQRIYQ